MSFDEKMADRVRELIAGIEEKVEEKRMFSGLCFMVNDKMCVAVRKDSIMVRVDPALSEEVLEKEGVGPMVHSGRIIKGFVFVIEEALTTTKKLEYWVNVALDYNKFAKSSKTAGSSQKNKSPESKKGSPKAKPVRKSKP
jgi:TfoX/Sxy family transcriptional regulator of competence genes